MKLNLLPLGTVVMTATASVCLAAEKTAATNMQWSQLPSLPGIGLAGAFAGHSGGALLVGGGANFPNGYPWQNGKKTWHDAVHKLTKPDAEWQLAGQLPRPLAYGVSITTRDGVLCVGGADAARHYDDVFLLQFSRGGLTSTPWAKLPVPLAYAAGALVGSTVYVAGGTEVPGEVSALNKCFALNVSARRPAWKELEPCPGKPRILPIAAAVRGDFYLAGGAAIEPLNGRPMRVYLRDTWRYRPGHGWRRVADLLKPSVAAPSPAPTSGSRFFIVGGDDSSLAGFQPMEKHPGFTGNIFIYDAAKDVWQSQGQIPAPRATAPVVFWRNRFVIASGEVRPGVRSPEMWGVQFGKPK